MSVGPVGATVRQRILTAALVLAAGAGALVLLAPAAAGPHRVTVVRDGPSAALYREVTAQVADAPTWVGAVGGFLPGVGLLVLLALVLSVSWTRRHDRWVSRVGVLVALAGAALADLASAAVKAVVVEERPCRAVLHVSTWLACPPAGHWSFPSDHAAIAGALATSVVFLVRDLAAVAVLIGLVVAAARVVAGVHYPHDVLAGLLLGAAVAAACQVLASAGPSTPRAGRIRDS
ncbi:phosphatase PAP2 family protein [Micromonospora sp. R77]|uniref:phosphatase PAP2 family protein n=1 Tax=Micromonospora sp. R77 TaxID=2925836 RepID=UPI001F622F82|nr:phosphatase PAP2 family protein [Micromonospora sp. R77]MCI4066226.1 phosphatase PAP2 family protein [Micromonospora sp. R77]